MADCEHEHFDFNANIARDGENFRWCMFATVKCRDCGVPFYWGCDNPGLFESVFESGQPVGGISPSVNFDCSQLRIFLSPNKPRLVMLGRGN